jgi:hypothetical protein
MRKNRGGSILAAMGVGALAMTAIADVKPIGQFQGDLSEDFNSFPFGTGGFQSLEVFQKTVVLSNLSASGSIKIELSSSLGGNLVTPISGVMGGQLGVAQWEFSTPVQRFGGMWENNSGQDDATAEFYDANGVLLGTHIAKSTSAGQQWIWNGWESDVPIKRILVTGNGLIQGFLWYENMQLSYVPEPGGSIFVLAGMIALLRRRT